MRRPTLAVVVFAVAIAFVPGCGSSAATAPTTTVVTSVAGTWDLTSVNSSSLPFTYQPSDPRLELLAKEFVISDAGTFTYSYSVRATDLDGTVTTSSGADSGTDTLADNVVTFVFKGDGTTVTATVSGATMTIASTLYSQTFTKR